MKKDRIVEFDIAKGIAILGIMMVHIPSEYRLIRYGIAFHVVVFFAVAGILEDRQETKLVFLKYVKKKAEGLLYPYFTLSGTYICVYTVFSMLIKKELPIRFIIRNIYLTISGIGIGTLWFLPVLFLTDVYLYCIKKILTNSWRAASVVVMIVSLIVCQQLYAEGILGSVQFMLEGVIFNELQIILKAFIAGGYVATGSIIWNIIIKLKNQRTLIKYYFLMGGGYYFDTHFLQIL